MSKMKYTPGPWKSFGTSDPTKAAPVGVLDGKRNIRVADVGQRGMSIEEINANAQLIAAAPYLLEALREVIAISDRKHNAWDKAHAAIAKAEGSTNAAPAI